MTDRETDRFLISTLQNILADMQDCATYAANRNSEEYKEIQRDFKFSIRNLQKILQKVRSLENLAECEESQIADVYDYIEEYYANLIISAEPNQQKKDLEEAAKLEELLSLFYDSDCAENDF